MLRRLQGEERGAISFKAEDVIQGYSSYVEGLRDSRVCALLLHRGFAFQPQFLFLMTIYQPCRTGIGSLNTSCE